MTLTSHNTPSLGPIMMDIAGCYLTCEDANLLQHPFIGGLILFKRNYASPAQLKQLIQQIRHYRPNIIIGVDQEGGRVQRFIPGFTRLPSLQALSKTYADNPRHTHEIVYSAAVTMAYELKQFDIDISFAPVLDIDIGLSDVIGDRAFGDTVDIVVALGRTYIQGLHDAGMGATGKHFPGHGSIKADSHVSIPIDTRDFNTIYQHDMQPFIRLAPLLDGMMPAHVQFVNVTPDPAGFSSFWLQTQLRQAMQFKGLIFSDDLSMRGASVVGDYAARCLAAFHAGCNMLLICNDRTGLKRALSQLPANSFDSHNLTAPLARLRHYTQTISKVDYAFHQNRVTTV